MLKYFLPLMTLFTFSLHSQEILHYTFENNQVLDQTANGRDGVIMGSEITFGDTDGFNDDYLQFPAANDYVEYNETAMVVAGEVLYSLLNV